MVKSHSSSRTFRVGMDDGLGGFSARPLRAVHRLAVGPRRVEEFVCAECAGHNRYGASEHGDGFHFRFLNWPAIPVDEFLLRHAVDCGRALLNRKLQDFGHVQSMPLSHLRNLLATTEAIGNHDLIQPATSHCRQKGVFAYFCGYVVMLLFKAESSGHTAAAVSEHPNL